MTWNGVAPTAPRRSPSGYNRALGLPRSLLVLALAAGTAGCALFAKPVPPPVEVAKPEPYVLLRLGERRVYVVDEHPAKPRESFPVAVGKPKFPTPTGRFRINEMVKNPDFLVFDFNNPTKKPSGRVPPGPRSPLGLRWIGFAEAHGWNVGFHGTAKTELLGQAVSHGCVRMSNEDVVKLYERVQLGTTVVVEP